MNVKPWVAYEDRKDSKQLKGQYQNSGEIWYNGQKSAKLLGTKTKFYFWVWKIKNEYGMVEITPGSRTSKNI